MRHGSLKLASARWLAIAATVGALCSGIYAQGLQSVRFVTFNVDFNNTAAEVDADIQAVKPGADVIMFQEAKSVSIQDSFGTGWTVYHITTQGDAKRGSALATRNSAVTQVLSSGLQFGVDSNGEEMLDRYIAWSDIKFANGLIIRIMSLHMPPARFQYLQPIMADNLVAFIDQSPYPVIVGADWNYTVNNDPYGIQADTGLVPKGIGIDGFYYDDSISDFVSIVEQTGLNVNSDHDPVKLTMNVHVPTYVVDNTNSGFTASSGWATGTSAADKYGSNYRFHNTAAQSDPAQWTATVTPGTYKVYAWWSQGANRSATAPYILPDSSSVNVNQQSGGGAWNSIGTPQVLSGSATAKLSCWTTTGFVVVADAIKFAP